MKKLSVCIGAILALGALGCSSGDAAAVDDGVSEGGKYRAVPNTLYVIQPFATESNWSPEYPVVLGIYGGDYHTKPTLDDAWREAIKAVVGISEVATGAVIDFDMQQMPSGSVALAPVVPFVADAAYKITLQPGTVQTAVKDLHVAVDSSNNDNVTNAPYCCYAYTASRLLVAEMTVSVETKYADVYVLPSEWARKEDVLGMGKIQLLVDGVDATACQGPPSCCIMEPSADGGMTPDTPCQMGSLVTSYNGAEIEGYNGLRFVLPKDALDGFGELTLRIPAALRGLDATAADSIEGVRNAAVDGDWVVWTFPRTQFRTYGTNNLIWTSPCD